jgi:hypothetical protein
MSQIETEICTELKQAALIIIAVTETHRKLKGTKEWGSPDDMQ